MRLLLCRSSRGARCSYLITEGSKGPAACSLCVSQQETTRQCTSSHDLSPGLIEPPQLPTTTPVVFPTGRMLRCQRYLSAGSLDIKPAPVSAQPYPMSPQKEQGTRSYISLQRASLRAYGPVIFEKQEGPSTFYF